MNLILKRLKTEWPGWLVVAFFALLPFGRFAEFPLSVFALSLPFLWRSPQHRQRIRRIAVILIPLFLCFWLPMVLSSFDSFLPEKSTLRSLAALRYLAAALSLSVLLRAESAHWRVLRWTSFLLVFWALDGFIQLFLGADLFGIAMHPDRLNAMFIHQYQFFGPTLAMLSPLLLEYARRRWHAWAWVASFSLILGAVLIAGMRSGWLIMGLVMTVYLLLMLNHENRQLRVATVSIPVLALGVIFAGYLASPLFQNRVEQSLRALEGNGAAVDFASSERLPIFSTALRMYKAHPVNGVGVRAFPTAYIEYAEADDVHVFKSGGTQGAKHAHNLVLEVMADTGTIGLAGLLAGLMLVVAYWRNMRPAHRQEAFPYLLALVLILFPVNSHFAIFGTYLSSLIWMLIGMWAATYPEDP
jgi:O-antigen ligase